MAILFSKRQRINPLNPTAAKKWYVVPNRVEKKSEKELAESLTKNTTLNRGEASMVIDELQNVILGFLLDGYSVQMGDWGSFQLTISSDGADTEQKCTADLVKTVNIRFRPGKDMKAKIAKAKFISR